MTINEVLLEKHRRREAEEALVKELLRYLGDHPDLKKQEHEDVRTQFARNLYLVATGGSIELEALTPEVAALPGDLFMPLWKYVILQKVKAFCMEKSGRGKAKKLNRDRLSYVVAKIYEEMFHVGVMSDIWKRRRQEDAVPDLYKKAA